MRQMTGLNELREQGRMTWIEQEHGWVAVPDEVLNALAEDGFDECKREMTTSRRDCRPAGGVWQGVDTRTGSVASAIWVNRPPWHQAIVAGGVWQGARTKSVASAIGVNRPAGDQAIVFIAIDGESFRGARLPSMDFSKQVLATCPTNPAVLALNGVGWNDLGTPRRIMATLAGTGS